MVRRFFFFDKIILVVRFKSDLLLLTIEGRRIWRRGRVVKKRKKKEVWMRGVMRDRRA